jgi:hypothetical protein
MVGYPDFHTSIADADPSLVAGELFMNNFIAAGSVVARKKALLDAGGFDENIGGGADDYDMWLRLCRSSRFVFLDSIQLLSRVHSSNFTERSRTADDTFIVLARAEKDLGIPAEIAGRSYARQYYKRCRFRFLGGDYAGAVSDLEKAVSIPGPRARYRTPPPVPSIGASKNPIPPPSKSLLTRLAAGCHHPAYKIKSQSQPSSHVVRNANTGKGDPSCSRSSRNSRCAATSSIWPSVSSSAPPSGLS